MLYEFRFRYIVSHFVENVLSISEGNRDLSGQYEVFVFLLAYPFSWKSFWVLVLHGLVLHNIVIYAAKYVR